MMIIGAKKTFRFFFQKRKIKGTSCFLGGIGLVLLGWPVVGMCVEGFGFLNLFGDFFPIALGFLRNMPIIGPRPSRKVRFPGSSGGRPVKGLTRPPPMCSPRLAAEPACHSLGVSPAAAA
jgi:hypothetical protein